MALSAARFDLEYQKGDIISLEAAGQVYENGMVNFITAATNRGQIVAADDVANRSFAGVALEDGEDGDMVKVVLRGIGNFKAHVNLSTTNPGTSVYVEDDEQVTTVADAGEDILVGKLIKGATANNMARVSFKSALLA